MGGVYCERRPSCCQPQSNMPADLAAHENDCAQLYSNKTVSVRNGRFAYEDSELSCVGHGSYGIVFRGVEVDTGHAVAVKKVARSSVKPDELKAMKALQSRYLVGLIDICNRDVETTYLVMELCDTDLDRHLKNVSVNGSLNDANFKTLLEHIARGYQALYEQKIVHRDIKPQNILLQYANGSGRISAAKITDFGISRVLEDGNDIDRQLSNVAGTLYYMAPEVGANLLKTCHYDHQVDMWSIGCVLYQCLTGEIPFDERSLCRLFLYAAGGNYDAYDPPVFPSDKCVSKEIEALVWSLLDVDSTKRATPAQFYKLGLSLSGNDTLSEGYTSLDDDCSSNTSRDSA
uniref:Protein kinase domain-containing protein n=1 Tax=Steinernema glaseri TaxID=37863 RepID=A0A1I7YZ60_9BILA